MPACPSVQTRLPAARLSAAGLPACGGVVLDQPPSLQVYRGPVGKWMAEFESDDARANALDFLQRQPLRGLPVQLLPAPPHAHSAGLGEPAHGPRHPQEVQPRTAAPQGAHAWLPNAGAAREEVLNRLTTDACLLLISELRSGRHGARGCEVSGGSPAA